MSVAVLQYSEARSLAGSADVTARVRAGASAQTPPEILYFLARDRSLTVRAAVAMNGATPVPASHLLARDEDERVRALAAGKLAAMAPRLSGDEREHMRRQTYEALGCLVTDEAVRVRSALADVLKAMPDAPRDLILALAYDVDDLVAEPVIRFSPLLTDDDLLALLAARPAPVTARAIARRPDLSETVSDAVAATADTAAVRFLLGNSSAAIREATLDALITTAADRVPWQEPLVQRPALSPHSARRLTDVVATQFLDLLARRTDLAPDTMVEMRRGLTARLAREQRLPHLGVIGAAPASASELVSATVECQPEDGVSETMVLHAAQRGDVRETATLLAQAAGLPVALVERAASLRSAKGLLSLIWKAGFTMAVAGPVQSLLAGLAPTAVLVAQADGDFPLGADEMRWQLDFLARVGR